MTARRSHQVGMTLLEVMVAMALLAVLGSMASKGLAQVLRARDIVYDEQLRWRNIAMAGARIGEDVTCAVDGLPQEVAEVHWQGEGSGVSWAIWGVAGSVLPVQYSLRKGMLMRTVGHDLSRSRSTQPGAEQAHAAAAKLDTPLLSGVQGMALSFLDSRGEWHDSWPFEGAAESKPKALRVALTLDDGRIVTRMYALP